MANQYTRNAALLEGDLLPDPIAQFRQWLECAKKIDMIEPTAMILATVGPDGRPSARVVLLKGIDDGFCFYTSYESRKAGDLEEHPEAALVFWWDRLERSVRVEGKVNKLTTAESKRYFHSRPRGSQLSALTSHQSRPVASRNELDAKLAANTVLYANAEVPFPRNWGGYRLIPVTVEFWQGRRDRFHDRLVYFREGSNWRIQRLEP